MIKSENYRDFHEEIDTELVLLMSASGGLLADNQFINVIFGALNMASMYFCWGRFFVENVIQ